MEVALCSPTQPLIGGTLTSSNGGAFTVPQFSESVLDGAIAPIQDGASVMASDGGALSLLGVIDNSGQITSVESIWRRNRLDETVGPVTTLQGAGTVTLSGALAAIHGDSTLAELDNVNNHIQGSGFIGEGQLQLVNGGVINATGALLIDTGAATITNNGVLEATGGTLTIASPVTNGNFGELEAIGGGNLVTEAPVAGGKVVIDDGDVRLAASFSGEAQFAGSGILDLAHTRASSLLLPGFQPPVRTSLTWRTSPLSGPARLRSPGTSSTVCSPFLTVFTPPASPCWATMLLRPSRPLPMATAGLSSPTRQKPPALSPQWPA